MVVFVFIILLILAVVIVIVNSNDKKRLEKKYRDALKGIDKAEALYFGRKYYAKLRGNNTLTIYDEQAITNDISTMKTERRRDVKEIKLPAATDAVLDKLERLAQLKNQGILTDQEFATQKEKILSGH